MLHFEDHENGTYFEVVFRHEAEKRYLGRTSMAAGKYWFRPKSPAMITAEQLAEIAHELRLLNSEAPITIHTNYAYSFQLGRMSVTAGFPTYEEMTEFARKHRDEVAPDEDNDDAE